jgi:hypothetical protein
MCGWNPPLYASHEARDAVLRKAQVRRGDLALLVPNRGCPGPDTHEDTVVPISGAVPKVPWVCH